jgi:hypothetical protein
VPGAALRELMLESPMIDREMRQVAHRRLSRKTPV